MEETRALGMRKPEPGPDVDDARVNESDNTRDETRRYNTILGTSGEASDEPHYSIGPLVTEADIIAFARDECRRSGESLVELAGIGWEKSEEGDVVAARDWEPGEEFYTAIAKLNDEGRLFEIYDCESEVDAFLDRAAQLGIGTEASDKRGKR